MTAAGPFLTTVGKKFKEVMLADVKERWLEKMPLNKTKFYLLSWVLDPQVKSFPMQCWDVNLAWTLLEKKMLKCSASSPSQQEQLHQLPPVNSYLGMTSMRPLEELKAYKQLGVDGFQCSGQDFS